ncbi:c-type cytochrome [Novosphingobium decolorationis]|uniref:Cytochrome c domain-containing protein n=1 Tax=Novosphingobium decolorationis TaxID=2698673 RepID=A0ABX8E5C0_9SPHN|nr:hypothetical protein [Novosphingobium decolorationis]MED5546233.1 hypothetical protein [Pseudomonadota bacterium]QVM84174.1 hypothetical protein HT578_11185 [Novosphingobium decolorationis]
MRHPRAHSRGPGTSSIALGLGLALALCACSGGEQSEAPTTPEPSASATLPESPAEPDSPPASQPSESPSPQAEASPEPSPTPTPTETKAAPAPKPAPAPTPSPEPVAAAGPPAAFGRCAVCHNAEKGAPDKLGPNLFGTFGHPMGQGSFAYSDALKNAGLTMDEATLHQWLENPRKLVPGNRMSFPGIKDAAKRQEIIDYLKKLR